MRVALPAARPPLFVARSSCAVAPTMVCLSCVMQPPMAAAATGGGGGAGRWDCRCAGATGVEWSRDSDAATLVTPTSPVVSCRPLLEWDWSGAATGAGSRERRSATDGVVERSSLERLNSADVSSSDSVVSFLPCEWGRLCCCRWATNSAVPSRRCCNRHRADQKRRAHQTAPLSRRDGSQRGGARR